MRAPLWLIVLLLLAAIGVGVYGYFTAPLPFGLSSVVRTPGGLASAGPTAVPTPVGARTVAGQALVLGATSVSVQTIQRNQDLTTGGRGGPAGLFTVVDILLRNDGTEPLIPKPTDFRLVDDRGRSYAVDTEATRAVNSSGRRRVLFDASVPPTGSFDTLLAFETPVDANALLLRVTLGYGDLELPR